MNINKEGKILIVEVYVLNIKKRIYIQYLIFTFLIISFLIILYIVNTFPSKKI